MTLKTILLGACSALAFSTLASAETLTIATVNNGDMIRMQGLTSDFTTKNPDIKVEWVTLEENVLRERVTTDIATNGGQYDIMTIGNYEVPIWAKQGWLLPLESLATNTTWMIFCRRSVVVFPAKASFMRRRSTANPP